MATLPVSTAVDISTSIRAGGVLRTQFGTGLLVTLDDALPAGGSNKAQVFADIESVNRVLSAGDALDAATVWFGADPPPKSLYIGRWATVDVATTLQGRHARLSSRYCRRQRSPAYQRRRPDR